MSVSADAALVLIQGGYAEAAEIFCVDALAKTPDDAMLWQIRGVAAYQRDDLPAARDYFARGVTLDPENEDGQNNLAEALKQLARFGESIPVYERALALNPANSTTLVNYSNALLENGRHGDAVLAARQALEFKPDWVPALQNLSLALWASGHVGEAIRIVGRAVELEPEGRVASNLLMFLQYSAEHTEDALYDAARSWGARHQNARTKRKVSTPVRLRIGYVSSDLRDHPVGYQIEKVVAGHDRARVEVFLYATAGVQDAVTERLRKSADGWRDLTALDAEAAARRIEDDGIHVLIDLSGHTAHHRLDIFARRPAPVQASWLGYFATTGLSQIDFVLRDRAQIPPDEAPYYTEKVWPIENASFGYEPNVGCPGLSPLPALENGFVTFGCFANPAKISDATISAWARVLLRTPGSRMILDRKGIDDPLAADRILAEFARHGVGPERLSLGASRGHLAYMARYAEVDVVLDTFPCNGATTTYEALWMGVPVISRRWGRMVGHFAESILEPLGYADWVAHDEDGYVGCAVAMTADLERLASLRASLRSTLAASPLCQAGDCARGLEDAYEGMWRTLCGETVPSSREIEAYSRFGIEAFERKRTDLAERIFRRAVDLTPERADAHNDLGEILRQTGRPEGAIPSFRRALSIDPDHAGAHGNLGAVLASLGCEDEARTHLERAVTLDPDAPEPWFDLAPLLALKGEIAEGLSAFERGGSLSPDLIAARGPAIFAALGDALVDRNRFEEAVVLFVESVKFKVGIAYPERIRAEASEAMSCSLERAGYVEEAARWRDLAAA